MIHTFTCRIRVPEELFDDFINHISTKVYDKSGKFIAQNNILKDWGITLYAYKYQLTWRDRDTNELTGYMRYVIDARVNPSKVIGRNTPIQVYRPADYSVFESSFNALISTFEFLPSLEAWKAYRIDLTYNLKTKYVKEYIHLMHKADLSGFMIPSDHHGHRSMKEGSLYVANTQVTLNFYDKSDEMIKSGSRHTVEEIQEAADILRIEVQAGRDKLSGIKRKQDLSSKQIAEFLVRPGAAEELVVGYSTKVLGSGTYRKKPAAVNLIKKSNLKQKTKTSMIKLIDEVSKPYQRVDKVFASDPTLKKYKQQFRKLNINPVTLTKNAAVAELPSIPDLLKRAIEDENNS